jgi:hypothetical protein
MSQFNEIPEGEFVEARWRAVEGVGAQVFRVRRTPGGHVALGAIAMPEEDGGIGLEVTIELDANWLVRSAYIEASDGRELALDHDGAGSWIKNGVAALDLAGCMDIDLSASPITNTLPVRRLPWRKGQGRACLMAYIKAPELQVFKNGQRYTCLGDRRFRFEDLDGSFTDDIAFDANGLIAEYPQLFHRA